MRAIYCMTAVALVAACDTPQPTQQAPQAVQSMTLDVLGETEDGGEKFFGTATGNSDGAGTLRISSDKGLNCVGRFVYVTRREGKGTFNCDSGQSGPFEFVSTGARGTGTGRIGKRLITFRFM